MDESAFQTNETTLAAIRLARLWFVGQRVGGQDALAHAVEVVDVLMRHVPDAAPEVVAAVLLHDSPDLAPREVDLRAVLATLVSHEVARLVEALHQEHQDLDAGKPPTPPVSDPGLMQASAADKVVSIAVILERSWTSDPKTFWAERRAFVRALPYLRDFADAAHGVLPPTMVAKLSELVGRAEFAATHA